MAQNDIALMGAVYPDVPAVTLPIDGGGTAKFTDVSDTTASASDVAQGKYFYTSSGVYTQGTASGGGGASNVVTGTFKGTTTGAAMDVTIPYTGTGYQISVCVYPSSGFGEGDFGSLRHQYAIVNFMGSKRVMSTIPSYNQSATNGSFCVDVMYKSSSTSATNVSSSRSTTASLQSNGSATDTATLCVKFKSKTTMSVYIAASGSYGFPANIEYTYVVNYSS